MKNLSCTKCEEVKPESEFYFSNRSKGIRKRRCKSCVKEYGKKHYEENKERFKKYNEENKERFKERIKKYNEKYYEKYKERFKARRMAAVLFIYEYFLTHHCVDCGESDPLVLEFDHVRGKKDRDVSALVSGYSLERIKAEIAKCEVRCRNCHTKRHAIENNTLMVQIVKETC